MKALREENDFSLNKAPMLSYPLPILAMFFARFRIAHQNLRDMAKLLRGALADYMVIHLLHHNTKTKNRDAIVELVGWFLGSCKLYYQLLLL